jgi:ABC-type uncharacterized transport system substrate-binding protein
MKVVLMRLFSVLTATAALLLSLLPTTISAHPHVWIECGITAVFDNEGLTGFRQRWVLDEMFSASMLPVIDLNNDGRISPEESEVAKREAFDNLKEYNYFTDVRIDGKPFLVEYVKDFVCTLDGEGRLIYEFFVPCTVKAVPTPKTVTIGVYDASFFCDIGCMEIPLSRDGVQDGLVVESKRVELTDTPFDQFQFFPAGIEIRFRTK